MKRVALLVVGCLLTSPGWADTISFSDLMFEATGQSMWQPGTAGTLDENPFYGVSWNKSSSVGGITGSAPKLITAAKTVPTNPAWFTWAVCKCYSEPPKWNVTTPAVYSPDTRTGLQGTASTSGRVGFELGLKADSGSVNASVGYDVSLEVPDNVQQGQFVNLNPLASLDQGGSLNTNFPTLEAYAAVVVEASASFNGKGCLVPFSCAEFNVSTGKLGGTQEIISLNQDGEGGIEYFDGNPVLNLVLEQALGTKPPAGLPATFSSSLADVTVYLPQPDATGGVQGDTLKATGQDDLLDYFVDVDSVVSLGLTGTTNLFGGSFDLGVGSLSYNLIDVKLGPTLDLKQSFELDPKLFVDLAFSAPVNVMGIGQVMSLTGLAWDALPSMAFLTDTLVTQTFYLGFEQGGQVVRNTADFLNQLMLDLDGTLKVGVLDANLDFGIFGSLDLGIGNILNNSIDLFTTPPIFNQQFGLGGFNEESRSFMVSLAAAAVPEPGTISLLGLGLLAMGLLRRRQAVMGRR